MTIYAIGDLHLSGDADKPMDIFGDNWQDHGAQIAGNWDHMINEDDIVLIPGDISWAMTLQEAHVDLDMIHHLPGQKILIKGNHDYWWQSISQLNKLYEKMYFLQNTSYKVGDYAICGSRGWGAPGDGDMDVRNTKIYNREIKRLELSLDHAMKSGCKKIIVMLHYPPTNDRKQSSEFTKIFEKYPVTHVVYGHLHGEAFFNCSLRGTYNGIEYTLVSADAIGFKPHKIISIENERG
ncbi:MAG TPA: serine/threonine protein phosphatase [Epulopiscium sp.]|nr:serine/threonine protein phosphatase [Candidatus Epulonipiscium sp.]